MDIDKKYEQWKAITESDFVTLFIKTWFTFIAVLRELNPDVSPFDVNGMPKGDKPFLNAYKSNVMPIVQKELSPDVVAKELFNLYPSSLNKIIEVFPQFFFQTFFAVNRNFNLYDKSIDVDSDGNFKERYELSMTIVDDVKIRFYLGMSGKYRSKSYNEKIKKDIDLRLIVKELIAEYKYKNLVFDDSGFIRSFYSKVLKVISERIRYYLDNTLPLKGYNKTILGKIKDGCLRAFSWINIKFEYNYKPPHLANVLDDMNSYAIIMQQPFNGFSIGSFENIIEQDRGFYNQIIITKGIEWFASYVYSLRNALFHEIINPLDEEWQTIFKSAYLLLKQVSDVCVSCIAGLEEFVQDVDNIILDYIYNHQVDLFSSFADYVEFLDFYEMTLDKYQIVEGKYHLQGTVTVVLKLQNGTSEEIEEGVGEITEDYKLFRYDAYLDNLSTFSLDEDEKEKITIEMV